MTPGEIAALIGAGAASAVGAARAWRAVGGRRGLRVALADWRARRALVDAVARLEREVAVAVRRGAIAEGRWRALHEHDQRGLAETDASGRVVWANDTLARMMGLEAGDVLCHGWANALANGERIAAQDEWRRCVAEERIFDRALYYYLTSTRVRARALPIRDDAGAVAAWLAIVERA